MDKAETSAAESRARREARDWIVRLNSGAVAEQELRRFHDWRGASALHQRAFAVERAFWQDLQGVGAAVPALPEARPASFRRRAVLSGGLATAAAAGVFGTPRLIRWWQSDFTTSVGEMADLTLPDGSLATLNTDSAIGFDFASGRREVTVLQGEAEFRVADLPRAESARPLRVTALNGVTEAVGGSLFMVDLTPKRVRVTLAEGLAHVTVGRSGDVRMEVAASQQAYYRPDRTNLQVGPVDPEMVFAWRQGRIIFENRRFDDAMDELGRYLPERIVLGAGVDPALPVSAIFQTRDARQAVDALAKTQGVHVRRVPHLLLMVG